MDRTASAASSSKVFPVILTDKRTKESYSINVDQDIYLKLKKGKVYFIDFSLNFSFENPCFFINSNSNERILSNSCCMTT